MGHLLSANFLFFAPIIVTVLSQLKMPDNIAVQYGDQGLNIGNGDPVVKGDPDTADPSVALYAGNVML